MNIKNVESFRMPTILMTIVFAANQILDVFFFDPYMSGTFFLRVQLRSIHVSILFISQVYVKLIQIDYFCVSSLNVILYLSFGSRGRRSNILI